MSVKAVKWAMFQAVGDAQSKLLLMTLAEHHNEKTGCCDPGQKRLSIQCECDEEGRTVRRHLAKLESAGFLRKQKRGGKGDGRQSDEYELALDRPGELKGKVEKRRGGGRRGELLLPAAFARCRCLSPCHCSVSSSRSSNATCGFPALRSPTGFTWGPRRAHVIGASVRDG